MVQCQEPSIVLTTNVWSLKATVFRTLHAEVNAILQGAERGVPKALQPM